MIALNAHRCSSSPAAMGSASAASPPDVDGGADAAPTAGSNLAAVLAAARAASGGDSVQLARRHLAFNMMVAERAEDERELQMLETLLMTRLKNDDEITKSWVRLA